MSSWLTPTIDFDTSHTVFPTLISAVLIVLGLVIIIRDRQKILQAGVFWKRTFRYIDKSRFFGTLGLTVLYFLLMVPVGDIWPNTGYGFLICSIPFVFLIGLIYMHKRQVRDLVLMGGVAATIPTLVWWLFSSVFYLTLP